MLNLLICMIKYPPNRCLNGKAALEGSAPLQTSLRKRWAEDAKMASTWCQSRASVGSTLTLHKHTVWLSEMCDYPLATTTTMKMPFWASSKTNNTTLLKLQISNKKKTKHFTYLLNKYRKHYFIFLPSNRKIHLFSKGYPAMLFKT